MKHKVETSDDTRLNIVYKAFDLFLVKGYEATTIRMICNQTGVESPTIYYYFKSKKGLFFAVVDHLLSEYQQLLQEHFRVKITDPEKLLYRFYKFCVMYAIQFPDKTRFYLRYRLFKPQELETDIDNHMKKTMSQKESFYIQMIENFNHHSKTQKDLKMMFQYYVNFIDNCTFNIIFSDWKPDEVELERVWNLFYEHQLMSKR